MRDACSRQWVEQHCSLFLKYLFALAQALPARAKKRPPERSPFLGCLPPDPPADIEQLRPGLAGTYTATLTKAARYHVIDKLEFQWDGPHVPEVGIGVERLSVDWRGYLRVPKLGGYQFSVAADEGFGMRVGQKWVLGNKDTVPGAQMSEPVKLQPGLFPIQARFYNGRYGASCHLKWRLPGEQGFVTIPAQNFFHIPAQVEK